MTSQKNNLLFITTSSLAANPRLVKEFETLKTDFGCFVLCFKHQDWSLELSEAIKNKNPEVTFIEIDRHASVVETILCKIAHKSFIALNRFLPNNFQVCAFASNDKTQQLWFRTKSLYRKHKFSRVIAHNLGAFYAAVKLSEKKDIPLQLDIEDFYPGEALYFNKSLEKQNRMQVMAHSFLKADSITYASEGIRLECEKHFKVNNQTEQLVLINSFCAADFIQPQTQDVIKCVWFSQHIGPHRGLEQVFEAAKNLKHIEFHLIGNRSENYLQGQDLSENIKFHPIMKQEELHRLLSQMDIGLALEDPGADHNRNICLTNKILTYAQSGLYILASDTFGQSQFLNALDYKAGIIINTTLENALKKFDITMLNMVSKTDRWQKAKSFSWENEQIKLKRLLS